MEYLKAVIIDDEKHCRDTLLTDLERYCPEIVVVEQFEKPEDAVVWLRTNRPDVLFLDVVMPGMTGFQMLERLAPLTFNVIFTTAYGEFALQALRLSAVDYLMKPVDSEELKAAVSRLKQRKENGFSARHFETLLHNLEKANKIKRLGLPTRQGYDFIPVQDILYFEADTNYAHVYIKGREKLFVTSSLKELEIQVEGFHFFRIHNSYLVNLEQVDRFLRGDGGLVVMSNAAKLPVSRNRKKDFLEEWEG